jgi:uncharacterized membrane protein
MTTVLSMTAAGVDEPVIAAQAGPPRSRLDSIDLLRGLVIVIMALDHVKGNFYNLHFDGTDLSQTTVPFFLTRWITHFCAPTFVFLAGTGAYLYGARGRSKVQLAWFLISRGLWLIFLELTVIRFGWFANVDYAYSFGQVIWAIGWSMILLAGLIFLPLSAITVFGVVLIAFHNLFDKVQAADWGRCDWLWRILHTGEMMEVAKGHVFHPFYPLIPWIGVLAVGYSFGALMRLDQKQRRKEVLGLGLALTLTFVALRWHNIYGDAPVRAPGNAGPWSVQSSWYFTVFSFINCQKYPPSLVFLLMTLGPALVALALFEREPGPLGRILVIFGRVPLFFYLLHWYVIKGLAIALAYSRYGKADWLYGPAKPPESIPTDAGYDLPVIYLLWLLVVALLFPLCYWFAGVKRRSRAAWLSYL